MSRVPLRSACCSESPQAGLVSESDRKLRLQSRGETSYRWASIESAGAGRHPKTYQREIAKTSPHRQDQGIRNVPLAIGCSDTSSAYTPTDSSPHAMLRAALRG